MTRGLLDVLVNILDVIRQKPPDHDTALLFINLSRAFWILKGSLKFNHKFHSTSWDLTASLVIDPLRRAHEAVENREDHQGQNRRGNHAADDHRRQGTLNLGAKACVESHGQKAQTRH